MRAHYSDQYLYMYMYMYRHSKTYMYMYMRVCTTDQTDEECGTHVYTVHEYTRIPVHAYDT